MQYPSTNDALKSWKLKTWLLPILVAALQVCAIRPAFKYLPFQPYTFICLLVVAAVLYYVVLQYALDKIFLMKSPVLSIVLCLFTAAISLILYPRADALKLQGKGSDADDAVIVATTRLFHAQYPYAELTYMGHKMSPGPGMLLLMSPFVLSGIFVLAIPFYVFLFALLTRKVFKNYAITNLALLLLMSCFGFWEYMIIGSDLVVIGVLLAIIFYLLAKNRENFRMMIFLSLLTGLILTSRITLIYLIPVIAWMLFRGNRKLGIIFGLLAGIACVGLHALFYYWQPENYAPLHLLNKGQQSTNMFIIIAGAIVSLVLVYFFLKQTSFDDAAFLKFGWLFIAVPHWVIGAGMVVTDKFNFSVSEGPGYLIIQLFIFILFYCTWIPEKEFVGKVVHSRFQYRLSAEQKSL